MQTTAGVVAKVFTQLLGATDVLRVLLLPQHKALMAVF
jgi:hypothetical protein